MQIQMRGNRIGVERLGKASSSKSFLAMPEDGDAVGRIRYVGDGVKAKDLKVGTKVYFGTDRQQIKMNGADILVMDEENIFAIAEDDSAEKTQDETTDSKAQ